MIPKRIKPEHIKKIKLEFFKMANTSNVYLNLDPYINEISLIGTSNLAKQQYTKTIFNKKFGISFREYSVQHNEEPSTLASDPYKIIDAYINAFYTKILTTVRPNDIYLLSIKWVDFTCNQNTSLSTATYINTVCRFEVQYELAKIS